MKLLETFEIYEKLQLFYWLQHNGLVYKPKIFETINVQTEYTMVALK